MSEAPDLAEPGAVADRNRKLRMRDRERLAALGAIMEHPATRAWMHDLLARCHMMETSYANNPQMMAFREGERNVGLQIMADITKAAADNYMLMMKEANERDSSSASPNS